MGRSYTKLARVFPRRTNATPDDNLAFFDGPPLWPVDCDEVHVSVTFTFDLPRAEFLAKQWKGSGYNVKIGGPALDDFGGEFVSGRYIKKGYTITSRGCNNKCWFCFVPKREGGIRELPIVEGHNVLDSNLLQCSDEHIRAVFKMLREQKEPAQFTGGLEAKILQEWHVQELANTRLKTAFFAYDTPDDFEPLKKASDLLQKYGVINFRSNTCRCYVLIGHPKDTKEAAEKRLIDTCRLGFFPFAMLYRNKKNEVREDWKGFQREWANHFIVGTKFKEINKKRIEMKYRRNTRDARQ